MKTINVKDYKIIQKNTTADFEKTIEDHLKGGYELYGSPFCMCQNDIHGKDVIYTNYYYAQAMVKYDD